MALPLAAYECVVRDVGYIHNQPIRLCPLFRQSEGTLNTDRFIQIKNNAGNACFQIAVTKTCHAHTRIIL